MALLIIGAVTLGTGFGVAIMGVLAAGAGLLAANDILGATGNAPLQSKKSKRKDEQTDKMHRVEQKALDAALASLENNIKKIDAPSRARPTVIPPAKSIPIPEGSRIYSKQEIDEMVIKKVDDVLKQQNQTDRRIGSRDSQMDGQNPSNSSRSSPDITGQDLKQFIRSEVKEALQGVVADINKSRDGRGEERGRVAERPESQSPYTTATRSPGGGGVSGRAGGGSRGGDRGVQG